MAAPATQATAANNKQQPAWWLGERRTLSLRLCFVMSMLAAAVIAGILAYTVTKQLEEDVGIQTYNSIASSALAEAQSIARRKVQGADILSTVVSFAFPSAAQWPNIGLRGYITIAQKVAAQSSSSAHGMMALVRPEEAASFEAHAQELYEEYGYPNSSGYSDFGFGIYGRNASRSDYEDHRYHDDSGNTTWESPHKAIVPFLQHSATFNNPSLLMMNLRNKPFRGRVIDSIMDCVLAANNETTSTNPELGFVASPNCGVVTDFTELFIRPGPAGVLFYPIFPADDPMSLVGLIGTSINWEEVLTNIVPGYVDGLDCVISTHSASFTYVIHGGIPTLVGEGDLHEDDYEKYKQTVTLLDLESNATESTTYTLTVYPREEFFNEFRTSNPAFVAVGLVTVILACTIIFFVYDYFMRYESQQRKRILTMKRRFVRFVSHEIRTPLNVVCMGLDLLQAELHDEIDKENKESNDATKFLKSGDSGRDDKRETHPSREQPKVTDGDENNIDTDDPEEKAGSPRYWLNLTGDIIENTQNAVSVLNDLLNYDKIESGTFKLLEVGRVDMWRLVRKTASEFAIQARNRKIDIHVEVGGNREAPGDRDEEEARCPDDLARLQAIGDDIRLTQAMRNLISNALKFAPEETGKVNVIAQYVPDGLPGAPSMKTSDETEAIAPTRSGSVRISVEDNGVGLTKDQQAQLFREGVQFDPNKLQSGGGSGLGLCISKEIVEQHGGTIGARSEGRDQGTTFVIEIPLYKVEYKDTLVPTSDGSDTARTSISCKRSRHILVVDDVLTNSKMLTRLLQRAGHTCVVARDGQEAVDAYIETTKDVDKKEFHTILMDFEMPIMNGPDATMMLRKLGCRSYIFGATGNVLAEDVALFKSSGADQVIPKPLNLAAVDACWAFCK